MRVKVCGLNKPENIKEIIQLPVDYIGFIFYKKSPRFLEVKPEDLEFLQESEVKKVGVFVNAEIDEILNTVHDYQLDFIQLHGNESPEFCSTLKELWRMSSIRSAKIIKAFSIDEKFDFKTTGIYERYCDLLLFDTKGKNHGGNGVTFDWTLLKKYQGITPFLLSGGIDEGDIAKVKAHNFPQIFGVDVNSKFELEPGLKDVAKVERFLKEAE